MLGTARIGRRFAAAAHASPRSSSLHAIASRSRERAATYAETHGFSRSYGSYEALLADDEVEVVYVALPNSAHAEWSVRALNAGKHVLCEKPLGRRAADAERVFSAARAADRVAMEAFMYRHHPQTAWLLDALEDGLVGEPQIIRQLFGFSVSDTANVRLSAQLDGGALLDVGCYCVHLARLLGGEPERIQGTAVIGSSGVDTAFAGTLGFGGGLVSQFVVGLELPRCHEVEIIGSEGSMLLTDPWHGREPFVEIRSGGKLTGVEPPRGDAHQLQLEHMADAIRGDSAPLLDARDGVAQARALEALLAAGEDGRRVR